MQSEPWEPLRLRANRVCCWSWIPRQIRRASVEVEKMVLEISEMIRFEGRVALRAHQRHIQGSPKRAGEILPWVHTMISNLRASREVSYRHLPRWLARP